MMRPLMFSMLTLPSAAIAGSPGYMAPEAFVGKAGPASDLWSLGVMLYELFSGSPPHDGYGLGELLARKCDPQGGPLSLALMCPGLPERLVALVHECLRYEASERPTAEDVARVLEGELGGGIGEAAVVPDKILFPPQLARPKLSVYAFLR